MGLGGRRRALVGAAVALPGVRLPASLARDRALRREQDPARLDAAGLGHHLQQLEPYYDAFEWDIGASGQAGNIDGRLIPGGNPFEAPRSRGYPNPPLTVTPLGEKFAHAAESLGLHPFTQPAGITSRAWTDPFGNHRGGCLYCGFCTRFGCEVDAKASPLNTHFPIALATDRYEIRTNAKVLRIETGRKRPRHRRHLRRPRGSEHFQPADVVVASAFTLENNRVLLLSTSKAHPRGIGNDRGRVGKNYTYQIYPAPVTGVWEGEKLNQYMGNTATIKMIYDYNADNFDHSNLDFIGGSQLYSEGCERAPITSVGKMKDANGKTWGQGWKDEIGRTGTRPARSSPRARSSRTRTTSSTSTRTTATSGAARCCA